MALDENRKTDEENGVAKVILETLRERQYSSEERLIDEIKPRDGRYSDESTFLAVARNSLDNLVREKKLIRVYTSRRINPSSKEIFYLLK